LAFADIGIVAANFTQHL